VGASILGADPSLAVLLVVLTGMLGASFGEAILTKLGVKEDISVGLSIGASAHGLGTAALTKSATKFSSAVVSMSLTGLWTVALLSIKPLQNLLLKIVVI
jgi:putative effector of murein hydrolase